MRVELEAIRAALSAVAPTHIGDVPPNTLPPYILIEPAEHGRRERDLTDLQRVVEEQVRVKSVQGSLTGALTLAANAKAVLSPADAPTTLTSAGRRIEVRYERREASYIDESVQLPTTNRSPGVVVETYTVDSQPL